MHLCSPFPLKSDRASQRKILRWITSWPDVFHQQCPHYLPPPDGGHIPLPSAPYHLLCRVTSTFGGLQFGKTGASPRLRPQHRLKYEHVLRRSGRPSVLPRPGLAPPPPAPVVRRMRCLRDASSISRTCAPSPPRSATRRPASPPSSSPEPTAKAPPPPRSPASSPPPATAPASTPRRTSSASTSASRSASPSSPPSTPPQTPPPAQVPASSIPSPMKTSPASTSTSTTPPARLVAAGALPHPPSFFEALTALAFLYFAEQQGRHRRPRSRPRRPPRRHQHRRAPPLRHHRHRPRPPGLPRQHHRRHRPRKGRHPARRRHPHHPAPAPRGQPGHRRSRRRPQRPRHQRRRLHPHPPIHGNGNTGTSSPTAAEPLPRNRYTLTLDGQPLESTRPSPASTSSATSPWPSPPQSNYVTNTVTNRPTSNQIVTISQTPLLKQESATPAGPAALNSSAPPRSLLDVAHNPAGAWTLRAAIAQLPERPRTLIFSCLRDKRPHRDGPHPLPALRLRPDGSRRAARPHHPRPHRQPPRRPVEDLLAAAHALDIPAHAAPHLAGALAQARAHHPTRRPHHRHRLRLPRRRTPPTGAAAHEPATSPRARPPTENARSSRLTPAQARHPLAHLSPSACRSSRSPPPSSAASRWSAACGTNPAASSTPSPASGPASCCSSASRPSSSSAPKSSALHEVAVYASNHLSYYDTPVLFAKLPFQFRILAKQALWKIPFIGWYLNRSGQVPVDSASARSAVASLSRGVNTLKSGLPLVLFPEGGRAADGHTPGLPLRLRLHGHQGRSPARPAHPHRHLRAAAHPRLPPHARAP